MQSQDSADDKTVHMAPRLLALIDGFYAAKDTASLRNMQTLLAELTYNGVEDPRVGYAELNEYIKECIVAIESGVTTDPQRLPVRQMIEEDIAGDNSTRQ